MLRNWIGPILIFLYLAGIIGFIVREYCKADKFDDDCWQIPCPTDLRSISVNNSHACYCATEVKLRR